MALVQNLERRKDFRKCSFSVNISFQKQPEQLLRY